MHRIGHRAFAMGLAWGAFAASASEVRRFGGETMGTTWSANVVLPKGANGDVIQQGIQAELDTVVAQMSTYDDASDLSRFNRAPPGTWHTLPPEFFAVLRHALALARDTGGAYDPTIGPLVNLWGFGPGERRRETPCAAALAAARARVGWQRIRLDEATQSAFQPGGVYVDLSSVAKGFGVDQVAAFLDRAGASAYLVEVGGELRAHGRKTDGSPWRVGVERPGAAAGAVQRQDELERVVVLDEKTIATSGDYRHFFEDGGRFFSHHIDPRTGTPVAHRVASVSIVADDGLHADPLGTAMTVLGPEQGLAYAKRHGIAVLFILHGDDGRLEERMSPAFAALAKP